MIPLYVRDLYLLQTHQCAGSLWVGNFPFFIHGVHAGFSCGVTGSERVLFSENVVKINRKGKQQRRVLLVTNKAMYNLVPASLACRRRILLQRVEKLVLSRFSDEFVVRVPTEYDYRFTSPQRLEVVQLVQEARSALSGHPPQVNYVDESSLAEHCITKPVARELRAKGELPADPSTASSGGAAANGGAGAGAGGDNLETIKERPPGEGSDEDEEDEDAPTPLGQGSPSSDGDSRMRSKTIGWARKETPVTLDDFDLLKVVGRGSFGKVMQVRKKDSGEVLAMKILVKSAIFQRNQVEHTVAERAILESIEHPFLIKLRVAFQTPTKLYLVRFWPIPIPVLGFFWTRVVVQIPAIVLLVLARGMRWGVSVQVLPYLTGGELFFHLRKMKRFKEDLCVIGDACGNCAVSFLRS